MAKKDAKAPLDAANGEIHLGSELILLACKGNGRPIDQPCFLLPTVIVRLVLSLGFKNSYKRVSMSTREGGNPRGAAHTRGVNNTRGSKTRGAKRGPGEGRGTRGAPRGRGGRGGNRRGGYGTFGGNHRGDAPRKGSNGWLTTDDISRSRGASNSRGGLGRCPEPSVDAVNEPAKIKEKHPNGQPYIKISQIASVYGIPTLDIPLDCFRRVGVNIYAFEASRVTPDQLRAARRSYEMDEAPEPLDRSGPDDEIGP
ncbi:hypothetical protein K525DRAFT_251207 [Schizophyllum commune Loenen D]|nr:hypothetical protein K525DRAFT_251207 [Schizophyllum commune Loenen D]